MKRWTTKIPTVIALAGLAALLNACIPSVNPFYTEKDVVLDERLLGEWREKDPTDQPELWKFEKTDEKKYKLLVTEKEGKQGEFDACLVRLKEVYFLDLRPAECHYPTNQADLVAASMFPGHLLVRVGQFEPALKLAFFDFEWLEKFLKANPAALAHHLEDKAIVLTAGTRELQGFVLQHLGDGELFGKPGELVRKSKDAPVPAQTIGK